MRYQEQEALRERETLSGFLRAGQVAVLPTDTVYGLSCVADDPVAVEKILAIKRRSSPMSLIPHDLRWAREQVAPELHAQFYEVLERYKGAYTTLWKVNRESELPDVLISSGLVGFRLPFHWITDFAKHVERPLITTSANRTGEPTAFRIDDLGTEFLSEVDFVVDAGVLPGSPSTLVYAYENPIREVAR